MIKYSISFEVSVPDDMTRQQVKEWIELYVNLRESLKMSHEFMENDLKPVAGTLEVSRS